MKQAVIPSLLLAALAFSAGPTVTAQSATVRQSAEALVPFTARELAPGVHLLATPADYLGPAISNVTIVEQADGLVVIDTGATVAHGRAIAGYIRSITSKPVKAIIFTHWHNDHPLGASALLAAWPRAQVIATERTRAGLIGPAATSVGRTWDERYETLMLNQISASMAQIRQLRANPDNSDEQRARYDRMAASMEAFGRGYRGTVLVMPTRILDRELTLDDPERPVRLLHLGRANTDGDALAWLPRQRIVATGDVVVAPTPFGFFSFPEDWIGVLERL